MSDAREEMIKLIRETHAMVAEMNRRLAANPAPDGELDSDHANFIVDKTPKRWTGEDFSGCRLSETNAEFCRAVAGLKRWKGDAEKAEGKTYKNKRGETQNSCDYSYKQAAWALGWAARFDNGYRAPEPKGDPLDGFPGGDSEVPF